MRFKKQLISEEIGLNKTNKKTFTKGKSQKIVMSEGQLQRLMVSLKEVDELGEGAYCPGGCGGCACRHHGKFGKCDCGGIDDIWGAGKVAPGEGGDDWGPTTPQAKFKGLCRNEQDCVNMNSSGCNAKGYGDVGTCEGSGRAGDGWSRREMGEGTQPCVQDQSCAKRHYWDENKCECVAGKPPARRAPKDISKTKASNNNSNSGSGSGILPQCCYRPDGTIMYQHCNNCPTRPGFYCANCPPPVSESSSETKRELNERRYNCGCRCYMCGGTYRALVCGGTGCYSLMSFAGKDGNTVKPNADGSNVPDELKYKGEERLEGKALDNWLDNAKRGYESKHGKVSDDVGTGTDKESGENNLKEMRNLRTTQPINEAQVDKMSGWFNRLNNAGSHYNPVNLVEQPNGNSNGSNSEGHGVDDEEQDCKRCLPNGKVERKTFDFSIECPEGWVDESEEICCPSVCCQDPNQGGNIVPANPAMGCRCSKSQTEVPCSSSSSTVDDEMVSEVKYTYNLIRKAIIKENIKSLDLRNYRGSLLTEQGMYDRNPGFAAAEGIENIIDNLKKGWAMIKDSTTRKQIQNTLTKLNNFMMYSAELVGSGSSQRAPRSYEQLANPLPFPELDEPEELEDIDDEISL